MWFPATVVCAADHGSYIIKVIVGAEYRQTQDHICEHHPDAVKPDMHPKVEVAGQPFTTTSISETVQQAPTTPAVQPSVAPATPKQAAAQTLQQQPAPSGRHLQQQMFNHQLSDLMLHLANLVMSVRYPNILLNRCKYNCDNVTE